MSQFADKASHITSALVVDQLPEFVRNNYELFMEFITAYYEYLEQNGKLTNTAKNIPNFIDVDYVVEKNLPDFITTFEQSYLATIPTSVLADKAKLLKHIRTFYASRGASKSFSFLFRALFNENVEIFNTGSQVLRVSDGKWYQPVVIRVVPTPVGFFTVPGFPLGDDLILGVDWLGTTRSTLNVQSSDLLGLFQIGSDFLGTITTGQGTVFPSGDWINCTIRGQTSGTTAIISDASTAVTLNVSYYEFNIFNIIGQFIPGETIVGLSPSGEILEGMILGIVPGIKIVNPGNRYNVGDLVMITGGGGANANAFISKVSSGSAMTFSIGPDAGGTGYQLYPNWQIQITGSSTPVNALITQIDTSGTVTPNSFSIINDLITPSLSLSLNSTFSNFNTANITINSRIIDAAQFITYANCGPITSVQVIDGGSGFTGPPGISITESTTIGNTGTRLVDYGAIGSFAIINPGLGYSVGDDIVLTNVGSRGVDAAGVVSSVSGNGQILTVITALPSISGHANVASGSNVVIGDANTKFTTQLWANDNITVLGSGTTIVINNQQRKVLNISNDKILRVDSNFTSSANNQVVRLAGYMLGGYGYNQTDLGNFSVRIRSTSNGNGAIIMPNSILGSGAVLTPISGSQFGQIQQITMTNFGDHYKTQPTINLLNQGDGTANVQAQFIAGQFQYPGYYLNEDGQVSSRRYLQDEFKYNNYSYEIISPALLSSYYDLVYKILNPAGSNMIGVVRRLISTGISDARPTDALFVTIGTIVIDVDFYLDIDELS